MSNTTSTQQLSARVALITGAGRGIGRAIARAFAAEGAWLALADLPTEPGIHDLSDLEQYGAQVLPLLCDLAVEEQAVRAVKATLEQFGQLDLLVNNAAIRGPTVPVTDLGLKDWEDTLRLNLTTPMILAREALRHMIPRRRGKIINIASVAGRIGYPLRAPYAVSKWGLIGLTATLAREVGEHNIQVNAICPGPVEGERIRKVIADRAAATGQTLQATEAEFLYSISLKRFVTQEDIAALALFLAADTGNNISGQAINVDAGYVVG